MGDHEFEQQFKESLRKSITDELKKEAITLGVKAWDVRNDPMPGADPIKPKSRLTDIPFTYGRHLDSTLEISKVLFYCEHPKFVSNYHPGVDPAAFRNITDGAIDGTHTLPWVEAMIKRAFSGWKVANELTLVDILNVVEHSLSMQYSAVQGPFSDIDYTLPSERIKYFKRSGELGNSFHWKAISFYMHRILHIGGQLYCGYFSWDKMPDWLFYKDLIICRDFPGGTAIIPAQFLLAALDKLEGVFSMESFLCASEGSVDKKGSGFSQLTRQVYKYLDEAYMAKGNKAVDLYKGLETLALGAVLAMDETGISDRKFLVRSILSLCEKLPDLRSTIIDISLLFTRYIKKFGDEGVHQVLEQYGQEKLHYFPVVESHEGLAKMFRIGTGHRPVDTTVVNQLVGLFKVMYIVAFRDKEGYIPPTFNVPWLDPNILKILRSGELPSFTECIKLPLSEWNKVHFRPHQIFDYIENELGLLDDKGIAPPTSKINQTYHSDALEAMGEQIERDPVTTRLVIHMLRQQEVKVEDYFKECQREGCIPWEWRVIKLKLKERELKLVARAFSILHPNTRHMASVGERNIKDKILRYFDQQSMTQTGVELKQTLDSLVENLGEKESGWVGMVLDLFQWNYTFRPELQVPFSCCLDEIFGGSNFVTLQNLFRDAILIPADQYCPPGLSDKFAGWTGHAGGNQGIFQKFWTLITLVAIKKVLLDMDIEHRMTGAGDNQVIIVNTTGLKNPSIAVNTLKTDLAKMFINIGLELKPEETWYSDKLFNYQRKYYYKGSPVSNGLKQVVRAFAEGSEGSMGLNSVISTSMNTGISIAASVSDPLTGPLVAYVEAYTQILQDPRWSVLTELNHDQLMVLSVLCTELGYLPFIQLHGFYYSGHADHATDSIAILKILWEKNRNLRGMIRSVLSYPNRRYDADVALSLVLDPLGLPVTIGPSPEGFIRQEIETYLKSDPHIRNKRLLSVFSFLDPEMRKRLALAIMTIDPKDLSLNHKVMENHVTGQCYALLNRFLKLGSLARQAQFDKIHKREENTEGGDQGTFAHRIEILSRIKGRHIVNQFQKYRGTDQPFIQGVLGPLYDQPTSPTPTHFLKFCSIYNLHTDCSLSLRLYLTSYTAGLLPERLYGPFVASPFEQLKFVFDPARLKVGDALSIMSLIPPGSTFASRHKKKGPMDKYLGGSTADSVKTTPLVNIKGLTERTNIRNILSLHTWVLSQGHSQELGELFIDLLRSRLPHVGDELLAIQPEKSGGSYRHRSRCSLEDRGSFLNSQDCTSSYIKVSSNYLSKYNEGHLDYNIFFQRLYNYIHYVMSMKVPLHTQLVAIIRSDCCTSPVDDPQFEVDRENFPIEFRVPKGYSVSENVEFCIREELHHMRTFDLTSLPNDCTPESVIPAYIAHLLMKQLFAHEKGVKLSGSHQQIHNRFSVQYNVSHFRMAPMNMLVASIAGAMVLHDFQNCNRNGAILAKKLKDWLATPVIPIDVGPFTKFFAALLEAGRVPDLLAMSKGFTGYLSTRFSKQLLRPLFKAIAGVLSAPKEYPVRPVVLVEYRSARNNIRYAIQALTTASKIAKHQWMSCQPLHPRQVLEQQTPPDSWMKFLLTPDADTTLALARSLMGHSDRARHASPVSGYPSLPEIGKLHGSVWNPFEDNHKGVVNMHRTFALWLRQLHRLSKCGSNTPNAKYKLLEILIHKEWESLDASYIMCLAEGGGSYAALLLHMNPSSRLLFNTYLSPEEVSREQIGHHRPITLQCVHIRPDRIDDCSLESREYGDLSKKGTWEDIKGYYVANNSRVDILTFDMEYREASSPTALSLLLLFLRDHVVDKVVVKLFTTMPNKLQDGAITGIARIFDDVELMKPGFSNYTSSEYFVVAQTRSVDPVERRVGNSRMVIHAINERRVEQDPRVQLSAVLLQLQWRTKLTLCGTTDLLESSSSEQQFALLEHGSSSVLRAVLDVILVRSETGVQMEKMTQHMLLGKTHGGVMFWEGIRAVLITMIGVLHPNYLDARKFVHDAELSEKFRAERWLAYMTSLVNDYCRSDKDVPQAYNWIGSALLIEEIPQLQQIALIMSVVSVLGNQFPRQLPQLPSKLFRVLEQCLLPWIPLDEKKEMERDSKNVAANVLALKAVISKHNANKTRMIGGFRGNSSLINIIAHHWMLDTSIDSESYTLAVEDKNDSYGDQCVGLITSRHIITPERIHTMPKGWHFYLETSCVLTVKDQEISRYVYQATRKEKPATSQEESSH